MHYQKCLERKSLRPSINQSMMSHSFIFQQFRRDCFMSPVCFTKINTNKLNWPSIIVGYDDGVEGLLPCTNSESCEGQLISMSIYMSYSALMIISLKFLTNRLEGTPFTLLSSDDVYLIIIWSNTYRVESWRRRIE